MWLCSQTMPKAYHKNLSVYVSQRGGRAAYKWGGRVGLNLGIQGSSVAELNPYLGGPEHTLLGWPKKAISGRKWYANYVRS